MTDSQKTHLEYINSTLNLDGYIGDDDLIQINVTSNNIINTLEILKNDQFLKLNFLIDLFAVDYPHKNHRFELIYILLSLSQNIRVTLKTKLTEEEQIKSSVPIFKNANWLEREIFDMYGIIFKSHPDLRRILTDYGFEGHPMLKDFPLSGKYEIKYSIEKSKIVSKPVELQQELREFPILSPWEAQN